MKKKDKKISINRMVFFIIGVSLLLLVLIIVRNMPRKIPDNEIVDSHSICNIPSCCLTGGCDIYPIQYNLDVANENMIMEQRIDMASVLLEDVEIHSVEEAINYTKQFNGLCRHYATILYILMNDKLEMPTSFLISGYLMHLNGSDMYLWDDEIDAKKQIWVGKATNHLWVYDINYGIIDLMPLNESQKPVRIPVFAMNRWSNGGYYATWNTDNIIAVYEYYLGMFGRNNLPDINKSEVKYETTEEWLTRWWN